MTDDQAAAADDNAKITQAALKALSRRDYAVAELQRKLCLKGFAPDMVRQVLQQLIIQGWLNEQRFVDHLIQVRSSRGLGPLRIFRELQQRGVAEDVIETALHSTAISWIALARQARRKKFGEKQPHDYKMQVKQMRYLQHRGFENEQIYAIFEVEESHAE